MLRDIFRFLGKLYTVFVSVLLAIALGFATYGCWKIYEEVKQQSRFATEGTLVSVTISGEDFTQRSWRDILGNSKYISFQYQGKTYEARYLTDTVYVGAGDRVRLLYHSDYDAFRQPGEGSVRFNRRTDRSRLLQWSVANDLSNETLWLLLSLAVSAGFIFVTSSLIVTFTGLTAFQAIGRILLVVVLAGLSGFITYNSWTYYQYYEHLKANGQQVKVTVLDTDRTIHNGRRSFFKTYSYRATIQYQQKKKIIPISESDYERLKPAETLTAYYDESINDFMSVDYSLDYWQFWAAAFLWLITGIIAWNMFLSRKSYA